MFEAINNNILNTQGGGNIKSTQAAPLQTTDKASDKTAEGLQKENSPQVTEEMLKGLEQDIETMHSIGISFSKHKDTGRMVIKVIDKETGKVIRQIPSEEALNLTAKMEEMAGILFDKQA